MYGMAMRSEEDWGHVYVIDAHYVHWFRTRKIERLIPPYVRDDIDIGKKVASNMGNTST